MKNRTEDILNSLEGIQRAVPRPFFYTRLMAQLQRKVSGWERATALITKPVFAIAIILIFLIINISVLMNYSSQPHSVQADESAIVMGNDYGLSVSSLYDINPDQNEIARK